MQPRSLLTADDIRAAGFRPEPPSETADEQAAHVWYSSARRGERWDIGLGVYGATHLADADRYWADLIADLEGGDVAPERVAVGDEALHAHGWLYLRQGGQVVWIAVEGPDPVLARWAAERLARAVCPRVSRLPATPPTPGPAPDAPAPPPQGGPASWPAPPAGTGAASPAAPPPTPSDGSRAAPASPAAPPAGGAPAPDGSVHGPGPQPEPGAPPPSGDLAEPGVPAGPVVQPRPTAPGRYRRRHLARARLAVAGGALVVTDARGREHRLPLDGSPDAPAAIGVVLAPRHAPAYLAVLDGNGRLVVRDGEAGAWAPDDVRAFAAATGLRYLEPEVRAATVDRHRPPVEVEGTPWAFILLTVGAVAALVALLVAGAPAVTLLAVPVVAGAAGFAAARADQTRVPAPGSDVTGPAGGAGGPAAASGTGDPRPAGGRPGPAGHPPR